jgi:long-chain-fatty-acid--[acyl-carrier-protein] ligase
MAKRWLTRFVLFFVRLVIALRYRVHYIGLDKVKAVLKKNTKGALFLPNHPAIVVDPIIVGLPTIGRYSVRPLVTEYMFFNPLFHWVMRWVKALPVPNFATGVNPLKLNRLEKTLATVEKGLAQGEGFLIYPAGMTKQGPREIIGGAFAAHQLISKYPKTQVILVRTTGLWGSRFSRAYTKGEQVDLAEVLKRSMADLFRALIFFLPRRDVTVEFEVAPEDFPREATKAVLNRYLEHWYNDPFADTESKGEPLKIVPYSFWRKEVQKIEKKKEVSLAGLVIPDDVRDEVYTKIAELAHVNSSKITPEQHLVADLSLDSLNIAELITFIETNYDLKQVDPESLSTVAEVLLAATHQQQVALHQERDWDTDDWDSPRKPERVFLGEGQSSLDVFFDVSGRYLFDTIAADGNSGPVTYHLLRSRIFLLSHAIQKLPGERIGILLPSSLGAHILVLACHMAGKVPVMVNWTVGGKHLESVVALSKIEAVLTSWTFLDRLENVDLSPVQDLLVILEELRATFSWWKLATSPFKALLPGRWIKRLGLGGAWSRLDGDSEAVILFTSGTENMPKGVPLTHKNILSNIRATLMIIEVYATDRLLSPLPPFHSFGFTVLGQLPLLAGVRVFYAPNPTDSGSQARVIRKWGISLLASAPSFLINILRQGKKEPFERIRVVVSGAESPPQEFFELTSVATPNATVWEGYGITECSPLLCANGMGDRTLGVGKSIPGVRIRVVDLNDFSKTMPPNHEGMILACGPNVFKGYLQQDAASPFFFADGVNWYVTGDLGLITSQGCLRITGRLKRFVKIGGEMVSLGAVESALAVEQPSVEEEGPQIAVCAKGESEGRPRLVLFSTRSVSPTEVNALLRKRGFSNLVRVDQVVTLPEIPLSGTGKVAYRQLEASLV